MINFITDDKDTLVWDTFNIQHVDKNIFMGDFFGNQEFETTEYNTFIKFDDDDFLSGILW